MIRIYSKLFSHKVYQISAIVFIILLLTSTLRHQLFKSNAYDLGIFDQAIYLISQGMTPISTLMGIHILGDHAAWIFYLLAIAYKIYPTIYWLFIFQAGALASGGIVLWKLANLSNDKSVALVLVYFLYPVVFNINLFDFHPEVLAIPFFLIAVLSARKNNIIGFIFSILLILGCKEILSLTVLSLGLWLFFCEKHRLFGTIAIALGAAWFLISTQLIIPFYSHDQPAAIHRYGSLGNSIFEVVKNIFLKPNLVIIQFFTMQNLYYLSYLFLPVVWALSRKSYLNLIPAIPVLALNLLTDYPAQKDLVHHYSTPVIPFLMLTVISSLEQNSSWLKKSKYIILWSIVSFLIFAKYTYFFNSVYLGSLDNWKETRNAITLIKDSKPVLTWTEAVPQLSERQNITMAITEYKQYHLQEFNHILLNLRYPGWLSSKETVKNLISEIKKEPNFKLTYNKNDIFLFQKK